MTISEILNNVSNKINISSNSIFTDEIVGTSFVVFKKYTESNDNILLICSSLYVSEQIRDELSSFIGEENIIFLPSEELLMVEYTAASNEILSDRLFGLYSALNAKHKVLITNVSCFARFLPSRDVFENYCFKYKIGDICNRDELRNKLINSGYEIVNKIDKTGQAAFRGEIIDVFPLGSDYPTRIILFDDEIEELHHFNINTQESFEEINEIQIIPNTDFLFTNEDLEGFENYLNNSLNNIKNVTEYGDIFINSKEDLDNIKEGIKSPKFYKYFSKIIKNPANINNYFNSNIVIYSDYKACLDSLNNLIKESNEFIRKLYSEGKNISELTLFNNECFNTLGNKEVIFNNNNSSDKILPLRAPIYNSTNISTIKDSLFGYINNQYKIYYCFRDEMQLNYYVENIFKELFDNQTLLNLIGSKIFLLTERLQNGIEFPNEGVVILSEKEIFGFKAGSARFLSKFKHSTILKSYDELAVGDYVVHENYGIGLYDGVVQMELDGQINDFLKINYLNSEVLYIPLDQFKLIRKYVSKEGFKPKLSKLFSGKWDETKAKIKQRINLLADKLVELYSKRSIVEGFAFQKDDIYQEKFESDFDHELTPDQIQVIDEIKKDMESPIPMDRLVCGDVGFGKTEVAFRAAFKAILSGKQVLLLAPTTLLAKQHYERALERFTKYDVKIELLTRFLTTKQFNQSLKSIKEGKSHLIIGTHKALSKKIEFKDLGLLIIDEEQRFGVQQKESLKMKFPHIDVLTITATPIPRTLQTSLIGLKSLSLINTAPKNRTPIQTYLIEHDDFVIYDLIKRELARQGQVYYVHNNISDLREIAEGIIQNIPNVKVAYIHGQMEKDYIDSVMNDFYLGEIQVLITTTIIENGIDVPNANLIIVRNADRFGLAQLYQIKGRVGRSNKLAYAYLTYKKNKVMDEEASKRLKAIKEFTELGSGYKIAQRDLMIRGAGDILGPEQAGFIDDVGIDLYLKLLNEAIATRQGKLLEETKQIESLRLSKSGYIPNKYANDSNKFEIYQLIVDAQTLKDLDKAEAKIVDIYGKIPAETQQIIQTRRLKIKLENPIFEKFDESDRNTTIILSEEFNKKPNIGSLLMVELFKFRTLVKVGYFNNHIKISLKKTKSYFIDLENLINSIILVYNK